MPVQLQQSRLLVTIAKVRLQPIVKYLPSERPITSDPNPATQNPKLNGTMEHDSRRKQTIQLSLALTPEHHARGSRKLLHHLKANSKPNTSSTRATAPSSITAGKLLPRQAHHIFPPHLPIPLSTSNLLAIATTSGPISSSRHTSDLVHHGARHPST
jgi:hypothetical protein